MFYLLFALLLSFVITYVTIPVIICMAKCIGIHDVPDKRKIHTTPKPSLGGLGIFAGIALAVLLLVPFAMAPEFQYFIAAALVLFFIGLKDDVNGMSPLRKIIGQAVAAYLIVHIGGLQLSGMDGFFGVDDLSQTQSLLLTDFAVIVIINSINLIDGVDGLAGALGVMIATVLGGYFLAVGMLPYATLAFALMGSLVAFLIFNFQPARIFMGDTGSLVTGLVCAILVLKFITSTSIHAAGTLVAAPALGFTILMVPLLDCLRVFSARVLNRRSPFSADKNHIHHLLLAAGFTHAGITVVLVTANLACIFGAYMLQKVGNTGLIVLVAAVFFGGAGFLKYLVNKRGTVVPGNMLHNNTRLNVKAPVKLVALSPKLSVKAKKLVENS